MCGIAGIWGNVSQERLQAMADRLRHRGPDEEGFWINREPGIGLAHRRLSVIDLEGGRQPIFNEDGSVATVFNGEIYNYRELREELRARGHQFSTETDTETIVHLYEEYGIEAVGHLRGMFAIAIWDDTERQLVLYRDRAGKKPLYYTETEHEFAFASEIKGLVAARTAGWDLDPQALVDYLTWMSIPAPATIYRQVCCVEPAELIVVRERRVARKRTYWRLQMLPKVEVGFAEAVEQVEATLREAVRLRLRADVPVGVFLSGGIDSGIVTAMAAEESPGRLTTVTVGFEDGAYDERPSARLVADRYATDHHEVLVRPEVEGILPRIAAAYDQPYADSSAIPSYYLCQAARAHVKVVLNGDGGDEVFCGYRRYQAARLNAALRLLDGGFWKPWWRLAGAVLPTPRRLRTGYAFAHRMIRGMGLSPAERYLAWSVDGFSEPELRRLLKPGFWFESIERGSRLVVSRYERLHGVGLVDRMLATDFATTLPNDLLVKMDIASMAHGLETRSPLLDHVLVERAAGYPESVKLGGGKTKPLLRALGKRYLPEAVQTAPKRGFEVPLVRWLREDLRDMRDDLLLSPTGLVADLCERSYLQRLTSERTRLDPRRWGTRVWMLLMLALWDRQTT
ncbi:MAG: asparagine synthase (glutamine-hydrolyzing) [Phycisphaerae bacterium]|nr:asparagine synthase (glutamine-hydrolyzing) [Phycisphaerae bacterium]